MATIALEPESPIEIKPEVAEIDLEATATGILIGAKMEPAERETLETLESEGITVEASTVKSPEAVKDASLAVKVAVEFGNEALTR